MGLLTAALVAVGVGGGTFIAAPVIGAAAVGLLGFQAGGILAGSTAASMMSGSAIACGGGVPMAGRFDFSQVYIRIYNIPLISLII